MTHEKWKSPKTSTCTINCLISRRGGDQIWIRDVARTCWSWTTPHVRNTQIICYLWAFVRSKSIKSSVPIGGYVRSANYLRSVQIMVWIDDLARPSSTHSLTTTHALAMDGCMDTVMCNQFGATGAERPQPLVSWFAFVRSNEPGGRTSVRPDMPVQPAASVWSLLRYVHASSPAVLSQFHERGTVEREVRCTAAAPLWPPLTHSLTHLTRWWTFNQTEYE